MRGPSPFSSLWVLAVCYPRPLGLSPWNTQLCMLTSKFPGFCTADVSPAVGLHVLAFSLKCPHCPAIQSNNATAGVADCKVFLPSLHEERQRCQCWELLLMLYFRLRKATLSDLRFPALSWLQLLIKNCHTAND